MDGNTAADGINGSVGGGEGYEGRVLFYDDRFLIEAIQQTTAYLEVTERA